jgi:DNA-directed RNA polymerase subunit K/omega
MSEIPTDPTPEIGPIEAEATPEPIPDRIGPTVPAPHERPPDIDRRIRRAVELMFEDVQNPYEAVIVASQEARRINAQRLKARSILNQAVEQVEELVPDVPFVPRPIEDEEPEFKPTNEAIEKMAVGLVDYDIGDERKNAPSYYDGEIDFELYPEHKEKEEDADSA